MPTLNFKDPATDEFVSLARLVRGKPGEKGEDGDPGPPGGMGPLDALQDVAAPADTPPGMLLGTTAEGVWAPVTPPQTGLDITAGDARYLQLSGGTLAGPLTAPTVSVNAPSASAHAANKAYVDGRIWSGTQAQYNAIGAKDPTVLYVVVP